MAKYLDDNGILYFWQKIKSVFATKAELGELESTVDGIVSEGGQPNVIETVKVNGTALTPDANKAVNVTVPTNNNQLTNGAGYQTSSDVSTAISTAVNALDSSVSAETNKAIASVTVTNGKITGSTKVTIPTNTNQLTNGAGFQTASDVQSAINTAIGSITGVDFQVVQSLPSTGAAGTIYLVSNSGTSPNVYDEYIYVNNAFEKIGTTDVDLSSYYNTSNLTSITNAEIDTIAT